MEKQIKILLLEDSINDVKLLELEFKKNQLNYDMIRVETEQDFLKYMISYNPDIILSDFTLPKYDGMKALKAKLYTNPVIPFIIVTGSINEETAVTCIKAGADDYLTKDHLARLVPAMKSAIEKKQILKEKLVYEEALKESQRLLQLIADNSSDIIFILDKLGNIKYTSNSGKDIVCCGDNKNLNNFLELVNEDQISDLTAYYSKALENKDNFRTELKFKYPEGNDTVYEVHVDLILDNSGEIIDLVAIARDISERKKYEKEIIAAKENAEEMSRIKSYFLSNISHEFRTPLMSIIGFSEILKNELTDVKYRKMIESIFHSGKRLSQTLNLILNLSWLESNKFRLELVPVDIVKVIKDVMNNYQNVSKLNNIYFELILDKEKCFSNLDEKLLFETLDNIIGNAFKFTKKGSIKVVCSTHSENNVEVNEIKVIDTGIGIAEDQKSKIFEEFRQASEGLNRSFEGIGLGLTITTRYIKLLNGKITVKSELGKGSEFAISFPAVKVTTLSSEMKKIVFDNKLKVLIVEDDPMCREIYYSMLNDLMDIDFASNSKAALELANSNKYELVLMDINLGKGLDGIGLTIEIKKNEQYKETPFIALSAYVLENEKEILLQAGFNGYISKPFSKEDLLPILEKVFQ